MDRVFSINAYISLPSLRCCSIIIFIIIIMVLFYLFIQYYAVLKDKMLFSSRRLYIQVHRKNLPRVINL